ncbi:MAG: helix-hairpin-helix domain-containing protein, partial [Thermoanaerobaculia bacterium]|nr:helix-hairpin-helix domain-containing protein [Thermoanaerobaculia bacterium]
AADTVRELDTPAAEILESRGREGLVALPAIGHGIAAAIDELVHSGGWSLLDRLRGATDPERVLRSLPGIGPVLAHRLHEELHVDTLESLEVAAHDGRLEKVDGVGARRAEAIRGALALRLARDLGPGRRSRLRPAVSTLLHVDAEYRRLAASGELARIAPRRFNPSGEAWLPVGHFDRDGWHLTALFSNTARAHQLGRTHDWVVIYHYDGDHNEGLDTVVTETSGPLTGRRVVRGREMECEAWARSHPDDVGPTVDPAT